MHIYLYEPRETRLKALMAELAGARWTPVAVGADFFEREFDLVEGDSTDRPILLAEDALTVERIATMRHAGCRNPILVLRDARDPQAAMAALDAGADDADTVALKEFNDHVMSDDRVTSVLLSVGDGINLIRRA